MKSCNRVAALGFKIVLIGLAGVFPAFLGGFADAQVVINEVIADNRGVPPGDVTGGTPDMVELFNNGDQNVELGTDAAQTSYYLSDRAEFDPDTAWRFPTSSIVARKRLVIFCDGKLPSDEESRCELHASFKIDSNGREPITLFGPEAEDGMRPIVDQVWLPPLRENVSIGRFESGAGPAPVPIENVFDTFVFNLLGSDSPPTFGDTCAEVGPCTVDWLKRHCLGGLNNPGTNLEPRVDRTKHSTNAPSAGEPVAFTVEVRDDKAPVAPNIGSVEIVYRTRRLGESPVDHDPILMSTDGVLRDGRVDSGETIGGSPLDRWTEWTGEIPGQPEGVLVEFFFRVTDQEGLMATRPRTLCGEGIGPCDREFGGPNCVRDITDTRCADPVFVGERFIKCSGQFQYASGYTPRDNLGNVVVNEIVPRQDGILLDSSAFDPTRPCPTSDRCPQGDNFCCLKREDFIEIFNAGDQPADLSGLWLSDRFFQAQSWQFPETSVIAPNQFIIVWLDDDGGKCPDPARADVPCFWECPDPTDPSPDVLEFHTNFALNANGDQISLRDTEANNFGVIHGVEFDLELDDAKPADENVVLALVPNGDRAGCFVRVSKAEASPRAENPALDPIEHCDPPKPEVRFLRGDCDGNGKVEGITDAVFLLRYSFSGGPTPPCLAACEIDGNGKVEGITDAVYVLRFNFLGGMAPPPPFPSCGPTDLPSDLDPKLVGCETSLDPCM